MRRASASSTLFLVAAAVWTTRELVATRVYASYALEVTAGTPPGWHAADCTATIMSGCGETTAAVAAWRPGERRLVASVSFESWQLPGFGCGSAPGPSGTAWPLVCPQGSRHMPQASCVPSAAGSSQGGDVQRRRRGLCARRAAVKPAPLRVTVCQSQRGYDVYERRTVGSPPGPVPSLPAPTDRQRLHCGQQRRPAGRVSPGDFAHGLPRRCCGVEGGFGDARGFGNRRLCRRRRHGSPSGQAASPDLRGLNEPR